MGSKHRLVRWLALVVFIAAMASPAFAQLQKKRTPPPAPAAAPPAAPSPAKVQDSGKPNIVVIWGDDVGQSDISAYTNGLMGLRQSMNEGVSRH